MDTTRLFQEFSVCCPGLSPFVSSFRSSLIKSHKMKLRLKFLKDCLQEQVLPKSILNNRLLKMWDKPFEEFHRLILVKHIDITKIEVKESFKITKLRQNSFLQAIPREWISGLMDYCYDSLRRTRYAVSKHLKNKLEQLIKNSDWNKNANPNFVINLSDKPLNSDAKCALGYGLSFATSQGHVDYVGVAKGFSNLEKFGDVSPQDINICKGVVYQALSTPKMPNCPKRFSVAYNNLKKDSELHITRADKSNCVVILNHEDYISKMETLLGDENTYSKLNKNPLETVNSEFNRHLKKYLKGYEHMVKSFSTISPSLPYMYGLIKTHKPNNPIRPIICSRGSASYILSKWLVSILSPLVGTISNSHINNNTDLITKLQNINTSYDFILVSFDITSLFTRVPVCDLLLYLEDELNNHVFPLPGNTIINLIKLCVVDSKFVFCGNYYSQKFGMSMGNPLSPVLSNLYMEFFEKHLLPDILPPDVIWHRYVDDIVCIWPIHHDLESFMVNLNNLVPSIKFTREIENNNCLAFLDVMIHRNGRSFKFDVYRKPTNVLSYVHFYSAHHLKTKLSVFSSMFLRALRVCDPEFLDREFCRIFDIADNLKYPKHLVDKSLSIAKKSFYGLGRKEIFNPKNLLVLPFNESFVSLPKILKIFNVHVVFRNTHTVKNVLIKNSPRNNEGCVYCITCKDCDKVYIGQTGKDLNTRIKQHQYSVRSGQLSSGIFVHVKDMGHSIDWNNSKKIVNSNSIVERNLIESCIIKHSFNNSMNLSLGLYKLDDFMVKEIVHSLGSSGALRIG